MLLNTCVIIMLFDTYVICCRIKQTWCPSDVDKERQKEIENGRNGKVCIVITVYLYKHTEVCSVINYCCSGRCALFRI